MRLPPPLTDPAARALLERLSAASWRVMRNAPATGAQNMAVDEALLSEAASETASPVLRFYSWDPPAVSLGRYQDLASIDQSYVRSRGWDVVRRATGGRGVLHQHELTYSVVLPAQLVQGVGVRSSYTVLVGALNAGLRGLLGTEVQDAPEAAAARCASGTNRPANCFALASECDTLVPGGKLVGSAQVRKNGALLQHGSILLDVEPAVWAAIFGEPGHPVTLKQLLGGLPSPAQVEQAVLDGFAAWGINPSEILPTEHAEHEVLECRR